MSFPRCYNCGEFVIQLNQRVEDSTTYIDFIHEYGDCCTDIIESDYLLDPINEKYFAYIWDLIKQLNNSELYK